MRPFTHSGVRNSETTLNSFCFSPTICPFPQDSCLGLIQPYLMHRLLIGGLMSERATQRLPISSQMDMGFCLFLSRQSTRFLSTPLGGCNPENKLGQHLVHLRDRPPSRPHSSNF